MTDAETRITERMKTAGYTRIEAIASLNLGERSMAAARVVKKRRRRLQLVSKGISLETARKIVELEEQDGYY